jgi:hypothetical protein
MFGNDQCMAVLVCLRDRLRDPPSDGLKDRSLVAPGSNSTGQA